MITVDRGNNPQPTRPCAPLGKLGLFSLLVILSICKTDPVHAIEPGFEPIPAEPDVELTAPSKWQFDVAFGLAGTTNYISRGITNSGNNPAIQGYVEPSFGPVYVSAWSSNVDYGPDFVGAEIDLGAGVRPEIGPLKLDFGYVHYFYAPESVSPDYGELYAKADYEVAGLFTIGGRLFFAPDFNQSGKTATFIAGGVEVPLPHDFSVLAGIGYQFFEDPDAYEQLTWTTAVSYTWKSLTFGLQYWDTNLGENACVVRSGFANGCDARVVATVSVDSSWSALKSLTFGR